jgi:membrane protease YdiL (CAAX protease family)
MESGFDIGLALQCPAILLAIWLAGRVLDRRRFTEFGLPLRSGWWLDFGFGLFLGGLLITLVFLIELAAGWVTVTAVFAAPAGRSFGVAIIPPAVMFVLIGIQEEALFRGYHLINIAEGVRGRRVGPRGSIIIASLVTAVVFAAMHLFNAHASPLAMAGVFMLGIITAAGYVLTGELAIPIGLHITWNFFQDAVFGFPVSGGDLSPTTFVIVDAHGPALWIGDAFGPEAGLLAIGAMVIGIGLIALWVRLRRGCIRLRTAIAEAPRVTARGAG